jgi:Flp pilus assembly protein TadD
MRILFPILLLLSLAACAGSGAPSASAPPQATLGIADAALAGGAPQMALHVTDDVLSRKPHDAAALSKRGDALYELGRHAAAAASYRAALAIEPGSEMAQLGLGRTQLASDPAAAEALLVRLTVAHPRNAAALNDLGVARDLLGRHADAQKAYRMALAAAPDMSAVQVNLGLSLALSGHASQAIDLLRPLALDGNAPARVRHDLAAAYALDGRTEQAAALIRPDMAADQVALAVASLQALRKP